jgi:hypothetical protein
MKTCEAAALVLRELGMPGVQWGDESLLHLIANRAGLRARGNGPATSAAVLNNLARTPGELVQGYTTIGGKGCARVRCFFLPEHNPWKEDPANV